LINFFIKQDSIVSPEMVIKAVADYFNLKPSELKSKKRIKSIAYPRKIAMFILRDRFNLSLNEIGEEFGGKTTVQCFTQ